MAEAPDDFEQVTLTRDHPVLGVLVALSATAVAMGGAYLTAQGGWNVVPGLFLGLVNVAVLVLLYLEWTGRLYGRPREREDHGEDD